MPNTNSWSTSVSHCPHKFSPSNKLFNSCLSLIILIVSSIGVFAQTIDTATIRGRVSDPNKAVIVGAKVEAINESTGLRRDAATDSDGNFTIANLPLTGTYKITASSSGFADEIKSGV